jgi:hypothetical protein
MVRVLRGGAVNEIVVRDRRNGSWLWVNDKVIADPHLTDADVSAYCALATFANCEEIHPGIAEIAKRASVAERTARRALHRLEQLRYIDIEDYGGGRRPNVYTLLKAAMGCKKCRGRNGRPRSERAVGSETPPLRNCPPQR